MIQDLLGIPEGLPDMIVVGMPIYDIMVGPTVGPWHMAGFIRCLWWVVIASCVHRRTWIMIQDLLGIPEGLPDMIVVGMPIYDIMVGPTVGHRWHYGGLHQVPMSQLSNHNPTIRGSNSILCS